MPELLGLDRTDAATLALVALVELLELVSIAVGETGALPRAHHRPVRVGLHSLHEEVADPQPIEQVARGLFVVGLVALHAHKVLDVGVPCLQVDREAPRSLVAAYTK